MKSRLLIYSHELNLHLLIAFANQLYLQKLLSPLIPHKLRNAHLPELAREFGLSNQRVPRVTRQVRARVSDLSSLNLDSLKVIDVYM